MSSSHPIPKPCQSENTFPPPTFPLSQRPKHCWAFEHMAPAQINRRSFSYSKNGVDKSRPYYICTTCDNAKTNIYRNSGYPRGFVTWDDDIGIDARNPKCYCGIASRQDRKGIAAGYGKGFEGGFWMCASGDCCYYSDRKDGFSHEDAKGFFDFDEFVPVLLKGVSRFCWFERIEGLGSDMTS